MATEKSQSTNCGDFPIYVGLIIVSLVPWIVVKRRQHLWSYRVPKMTSKSKRKLPRKMARCVKHLLPRCDVSEVGNPHADKYLSLHEWKRCFDQNATSADYSDATKRIFRKTFPYFFRLDFKLRSTAHDWGNYNVKYSSTDRAASFSRKARQQV